MSKASKSVILGRGHNLNHSEVVLGRGLGKNRSQVVLCRGIRLGNHSEVVLIRCGS